MRLSRSQLLNTPNGLVHLYWRAHNKEMLLKDHKVKQLYFESMKFGLEHRNTSAKVKLHAFCIMGNHHHSQMSYEDGAKHLSSFMRVAHSRFGSLYNRLNMRTGKVANERPKTPLVGDEESEIRVHFYIEANPIRAGITTFEKLRFYYWNSYRYYAYGEIDEERALITPPAWYIALGSTPQARQEAYRQLFRLYLDQSLVQGSWIFSRFIGSVQWVMQQEERIKKKALIREGTIVDQALLELNRAPPE